MHSVRRFETLRTMRKPIGRPTGSELSIVVGLQILVGTVVMGGSVGHLRLERSCQVHAVS